MRGAAIEEPWRCSRRRGRGTTSSGRWRSCAPLAAERLGVPAEACLFVVGDDENLVGAERAGMTSLLIGPGDGEWRGPRIDTVSGVLALL
jgi:hypothetical protein